MLKISTKGTGAFVQSTTAAGTPYAQLTNKGVEQVTPIRC